MTSLHLRIYTRPDCHLCDVAKDVLHRYATKYPLSIQEINIDEDTGARELYLEEIPVIFLEETKLFKYHIDEEKLRKAIETRLGYQ